MIKACIVQRRTEAAGVRRERVVNDLDGILSPADPETLLHESRVLWREVEDLIGGGIPSFLLGLDSGGIIPTIGLSIVSHIPYKIAYKLDLEVTAQLTITEPYAVRREIFIYNLPQNEPVVVIDDEAYTGETLESAIVQLRNHGNEVLAVACLVENLARGARKRIEALNVPFCSAITIDA